MAKMLTEEQFPFQPGEAVQAVPDAPEVQITINRLDLADFADALLVIADRREKQAERVKPEKRTNLMARAIRLRLVAKELLAR